MNKHKISKDILIAGSSGIIGSFLIKNKNCKNIFFSISKSEKSNKNHFQLDLTEKSSVMDFCNHCKQFSTIIFLVGLAHNKGNSRELDLFEKVNYESLVNLLNCLKEVDKLPMTLGEAIQRLDSDNVIKAALPEDMLRVFMHYKNDEWEKFLSAVTQWDVDTYLDVLP